MRITVSSPVVDSPRVAHVRGIFDLPPADHSALEWEVELPLGEKAWNIGLLVGPSGCGKSTIARHLWPSAMDSARGSDRQWPKDCSLLDAFPEGLSIKDITQLLSSVGFSSPPAWLRPYHVLSTGQKFRVSVARLLAAPPGSLVVMDEFTSVVDRTVAQLGSAAVARTVRQRGLKFVAVTCHEDVEPWLNPDWVYRPAEKLFQWRSLQRRPDIALLVFRCQASAWDLFASHHYLSHALNPSAVCFLATRYDRPVAFSAWLPFVGSGRATRREHRTVTLPDYQGVGIGNALSALLASMWTSLGYRATSTTTHPAMIRSRLGSALWKLHRAPEFARAHEGKVRHATTRLTASFTYVGPVLPKNQARALLSS
jgi:ABC-type phosphate/phosphonate transport system ATPase subunit